MKVSSTALYKAIDKLLNYSLPLNIVKLTIELEVHERPLITVTYIPKVSDTLESDISYGSEKVTKQFNVVPIKEKKNVNNNNK